MSDINEDFLNSLPPEQREFIESACRQTVDEARIMGEALGASDMAVAIAPAVFDEVMPHVYEPAANMPLGTCQSIIDGRSSGRQR